MTRPSRTRRILKWTGVALSVLISATWITSRWYEAAVVLPGNLVAGFDPGGVSVSTANVDVQTFASTTIRRHTYPIQDINWPFGFHEWTSGTLTQASVLTLPFWLLLLLAAIPTAWLWHRDRRRIQPGCCLRCGYDLTGNTSGVCPECGDKVHPPAVLADSECGEKKAMANSD